MGYNLASTAACSSARHARVGSRKRKIADVDAALTLLSIEKMQPPRTAEQTDYHTVTVGEQAVEPAIEQAVVQAEDISYLEEDNRARVAESSEPTFSIRSWMLRGCTREGLLLHRFAQCRDPGCCVRTCRATHDKFRETYAIQSDVVVSNSATNELPFQGHRLSTSHLLVDRAKILLRHTCCTVCETCLPDQMARQRAAEENDADVFPGSLSEQGCRDPRLLRAIH